MGEDRRVLAIPIELGGLRPSRLMVQLVKLA